MIATRLLACGLAAAMTACSLQPVEVGTRKELLGAMPARVAIAPSPLSATLLIPEPAAQAAYDTTRMAYSVKPFELAYFAHTEWAEKPARMLQQVLVRTLERTRRFRTVATPLYGGDVRYVLDAQLVELRQDFTTDPAALRLVIHAELRDARSGRAIASREFAAQEPMAARAPYAGAVAANAAVARVVGDIARFVVDNSG